MDCLSLSLWLGWIRGMTMEGIGEDLTLIARKACLNFATCASIQ